MTPRLGLLATLALLLALLLCEAGRTSAASSNATYEDDTETKKEGISRTTLFPSRRQFPIIPPRLSMPRPRYKPYNFTASTKYPTTKNKSAPLSSEAKTRPLPNTLTIITTTTTSAPSDAAAKKGVDLLLLSSSDKSHAVVWPVPRRASSRRFRPPPVPVVAKPSRLLPKLLLPKPTRPAVYSLDGFVPKPSIQRITTTDAPPHVLQAYSKLLQQTRPTRARKVSQFADSNDDDDFNGRRRPKFGQSQQLQRKPVSRYTAFARKGVPGQDFPVYDQIPNTDFDCSDMPGPGMYADSDAGCQVWHMCQGVNVPRHSFLCPNGTIFNEKRRICDWWYNVNCEMTLEDRGSLF